ncbi:hypothetical protein B7P43_G12568 [Cryptotermes secundus]|uniref:RNA-directed DNA polymerase n=1 Tax=Cryptotermes secundus TaxID=105785 RepID=A0A2J7PCZ3_9NEOP|nr:hypothetical protein B7P43_G12568 [Cryptotermes secundus]
MQLQEYDLQIKHISGAKNFFADVLSRNPVGLTPELRRSQQKRLEINVAKIDLGINKTIIKQLKDLVQLQQSDLTLQDIGNKVRLEPDTHADKYSFQQGILCCKNTKLYPYWRVMIPKNLELPIIEYVHQSLGHQGVDKCFDQIAFVFFIKNLGRKLRKYIAGCDICQRTKHPNRAINTEQLAHLPREPGELVAIDLFGPLPTGRGGVKYLLVCLEVFTKHVSLYPLKAATTKSCLRKITTCYIEQVIKPQAILSDHGSQFTSPLWRKTLQELGIMVKYSPIRHPQSNPAERVMKELGKYFRIYCSKTHKQWPELVPYIQTWLNESISQATGYSPVELLGGVVRRELFEQIIQKLPDRSRKEDLPNKILKAYARMKKRAEKRRSRKRLLKNKWEPQIGDPVLVKGQPVSSADQGITGKFQRPYEGPYYIKKLVNPYMYELQNEVGKLKGLYHLSHLKPYILKCQEF